MRDTWIYGLFPAHIWNHFRSDVPRTNSNCEVYKSRLAKRAVESHLNLFELVLLYKDEKSNKVAYIPQLQSEQRPPKRRRVEDENSQLYKLGLQYMMSCLDVFLTKFYQPG
ncbi:uncharacterized protein [Haliotis asinina]|uniref:uncharacterized protein n=1 Tax=Haliotis asinina TaxID=109174 RepID=UPI003531FA76